MSRHRRTCCTVRLMLNWRREMRTIGLPAILVVLAALLAAGRANPSRLNPRDGLTYQWIPPGSYFTGCLPGDQECYGLERKREKIDIPQGFWIGRTEVTQA